MGHLCVRSVGSLGIFEPRGRELGLLVSFNVNGFKPEGGALEGAADAGSFLGSR